MTREQLFERKHLAWDADGYNPMYNCFKSRYYAKKYAEAQSGEYIIRKFRIIGEKDRYHISWLK